MLPLSSNSPPCGKVPARRKATTAPLLLALITVSITLCSRSWAFARGCGPARVPTRAAPHEGRSPRLGLHAQSEEAVAEAQLALEQARIELEAAKLRAEVEELERSRAAERRALRARQLLGEDSPPDATLDQAALGERLKSELGLKTAEDQVRWIMDSARHGAEALSFQDLQSEAFERAVDSISKQLREAEREAVIKERNEALQRQKERQDQPQQQLEMATPWEENDDRSLMIRVLGVLCYLLPLLDSLQYGLPLIRYLPVLAPFFGILSIPNSLLNAIPFGPLILFFTMSVLASNRDLPRLLRFNIQQAVLLDVALFIPSLLVSIGSLATGGPSTAGEGVEVVVFFLLFLAITYSALLTLLGRDPEGIPFVSDATRRGIDGPR